MKPSVIRIVAAVCALCAMAWLVWNVNHHGDELQQGLAANLTPPKVTIIAEPVKQVSPAAPAGLDLIDMYECMCSSPSIGADISGWVGLWFVTFLIGGIPTAILLRFRDARPHRI